MKMRIRRESLVLLLSLLLSLCTAVGQPNKSDSVEKQVKSLINKMVSRTTEKKAFAELEAMGCAAVPAIIANMDDRRNLPDPNIALVNKGPGAWEAQRFYGPKKVVDALDAILNQLTGHTGNIYNGGTDEERKKAVKDWREWLSKTPPTKRCFADVKP
jgi:hypothetical protein